MLNRDMIGTISALASNTSSAKVKQLMFGQIGLVQMKERMGIERALIANAYSSQSLPASRLGLLYRILGEGKAYLGQFKDFADSYPLDLFQEASESETYQEAEKLRNLLLGQTQDIASLNIDPIDWFNLQTDKINLIKDVEDANWQHVGTIGGDIIQSAYQRSLFIIISGLFALCSYLD